MAQILSAVPVGTVVKLKEGGSLVNFIVVHQGLPSEIYDASCNGTWVLRQDILENIQWADHKEDNSTDYFGSYLPSRVDSIVSTLDAGVQKLIRSVKVPWYNGYVLSTGNNALSCRGIILSRTEYGILEDGGTVDGAKLDYFNSYTADSDNHCRIANLNGAPAPYWTRTVTSERTFIRTITEDGNLGGAFYFGSYGLRYALVLEPQYSVSDDGTVLAITQPTSISVQSVIVQGRSIALSWSPVDGAEGYLVQRKSDNGEWVQVYRGAELSCSDTAGTWSSVQYRVQALYEGLGGAWKESATIIVHSDSILTISGQDGSIGTLTNDVTYSAYSNTGHTISLSLSVNKLLWKTENVSSGQVRTIPVVDLPTGSGTIVITAQVQTDLGLTSTSRTWSYQKTAAVVPTAGQVVQLTQKGKNKWPVTLAEAVRTPDYMGGNLSKTLERLVSIPGQALTAQNIPLSSEDPTPVSAALSNKAVKSYGILKDEPDLLAWAKRQDGSGAFNIHPDWTTEGVPMKAWYSGFLEKSNDGAYKLTLTIADNGRTFVNVTYSGAWVGWRELAPATPPQEYDMPLDSGWTTVPTSHCVYSKDQFGMVRITLAAMPDEPVSENTRIAVLPAGFRPAVTIYRFPVVSTTGTVGFGYITGSGELGVWPFGPMKEVSGSFQYIVKD